MAISKFTENINNIQSLADQPTQTATQLKQEFDSAGNSIKTYINNTLTTQIDSAISGLESSKVATANIVNDLTTGGSNKVASAETVKTLQNTKANASDVTTALAGKANATHTHTKSQITDFSHTHTKSQITDFSHTHDDRYYTESEIDTKLSGKANTSHTHTKSQITDFSHTHTKSQITDFSHTHDDRYFTESEITTKLSGKANTSHTHTASQITDLKSGATTKITSGTAAPSGGSNGDVYIQYFT